MKRVADSMRAFRTREDGSMVIETAIVLPVLCMLALGGFEASAMVARSNELQSAAAEAAGIVLASRPEDAAARSTIEDVVEASTGLPESGVTLTTQYRCGTAAALVADKGSCGTDAMVSEFITVAITDSYVPLWTKFGIGQAVTYDYSRRVQVQ